MGSNLSKPITSKDVEDNEESKHKYGAAAMQGWKTTQEDAVSCCPNFDVGSETALFAVYDGHGGAEVANYCRLYMPEAIRSSRKYYDGDVKEALRGAFLDIDRKLLEESTVDELRALEVKVKAASGADSPAWEDDIHEFCAGIRDESVSSTPINKNKKALSNSQHAEESAWPYGFLKAADDIILEDVDVITGEDLRREKFSNNHTDPGCAGKATATVLTENVVPRRTIDDDEGGRTPTKDKAQHGFQACPPIPPRRPGFDSGSTACVALIRGDKDIFVANAGDCRCVLSYRGLAVDLSYDHKPENPEEFFRISEAGGRLMFGNRINGGLNLSRAIGDHSYKAPTLPQERQMVTALPDIIWREITKGDEFIVIASDGVWNCMSSQAVVDFARSRMIDRNFTKLSDICCEVMDSCLAPRFAINIHGCDNMSCVIVKLAEDLCESPNAIELQDSCSPQPGEKLCTDSGIPAGDDCSATASSEPPTSPDVSDERQINAPTADSSLPPEEVVHGSSSPGSRGT